MTSVSIIFVVCCTLLLVEANHYRSASSFSDKNSNSGNSNTALNVLLGRSLPVGLQDNYRDILRKFSFNKQPAQQQQQQPPRRHRHKQRRKKKKHPKRHRHSKPKRRSPSQSSSSSSNKICFNKFSAPETATVPASTSRAYQTSNTELRDDILSMLHEQSSVTEASQAMSNLFLRAIDAISELMDDGNSTKLLDVTTKTGRMFTETTGTFSVLLSTADKFLTPRHAKYDEELEMAKLALVEETRVSLSEFLKELSEIVQVNEDEKSEDFLAGEILLIDNTKEFYKLIYDSTNRMLLNILKSEYSRNPLRKLLAARILRSAASSLANYASVRREISAMLLDDYSMEKDKNVRELQRQFRDELLKVSWTGEYEDDDSDDMELTPREQSEFNELFKRNDKDL